MAEITQHAGVNLTENEFRIDIKDGKLNYTAFPYPLEKLKGRLVVRTTATDATRPLRPGEPLRAVPDREEVIFDGFTATHAGAPVWMNGSRARCPTAATASSSSTSAAPTCLSTRTCAPRWSR